MELLIYSSKEMYFSQNGLKLAQSSVRVDGGCG